jgi:hypothetical protein
MGAGKTTYTFSANANVLSANFLFSVLPAGRAGMGQAAETESKLALGENLYVNLPTPPLNSSLRELVLKKVNNACYIKSHSSKLISTRRPTVPSRKGFLIRRIYRLM